MPISTSEAGGAVSRVGFDGPITIYEAADAKHELLAALEAAESLEFDLRGVEEIDTAGVQLLWLAKREAARLGKPLRVAAASDAVLEVLGRYGLAHELGLAGVQP